MRRRGVWLILASLFATSANSSVPPMPPSDAPVVAASCGEVETAQPFEQTPATLTSLAPDTLQIEGRVRRRWGLRIATTDPRVADVAGMELSERYGLLAVTRGRQWLSLDLRGGTLAGIRSVGVSAMKRAPGEPTSLVTLPGDRTYVAFGGGRPVVARYALGACGAASTAVPWIGIAGASDPVIVQDAYTYLGIVGRRAGEGSALVLPNERTSIKLTGANPLNASGKRLVAASNPARIVSEIMVARQAGKTGRTAVALISVATWDDVRGGPPRGETPLAVLPKTPSGIASGYFSRGKTTFLILAFPGSRPGTLDLYAFDSDVPL